MIKNIKAFTLIEMVIVIVIVGILSIIAVPMYKGYIRNAMVTEGKALAGSIAQATKIYYAQFGEYYFMGDGNQVTKPQYDEVLDIDARANKYFRHFTTYKASKGDFSVLVTSNSLGPTSGIFIRLHAKRRGPSEWEIDLSRYPEL